MLKQLSYYGIMEENKEEQKTLPLLVVPQQKTFRQQLKELKEQEAEEKARRELETIIEKQKYQNAGNEIINLLELEFDDIKKEYIIPNGCRTLEDLVKNEYKNGNTFFSPAQIQNLKSKYVAICKVLRTVEIEARTKYYGKCCFMTGSQSKDRYRNFILSQKIQEFICEMASNSSMVIQTTDSKNDIIFEHNGYSERVSDIL